MVPAIPCMMARFPQQRGLVSALAVGLAMTTRVAAFRYDVDEEGHELCLPPKQHGMRLSMFVAHHWGKARLIICCVVACNALSLAVRSCDLGLD